MIHKLAYPPLNKEVNGRFTSECIFYFQKEPYVFCTCCKQMTVQQRSYEANNKIYKIMNCIDKTGEICYE